MTSDEYRAALYRLGLTQAAAAALLRVDERTSRRWANGERSIPGPAELALALLERFGLPAEFDKRAKAGG